MTPEGVARTLTAMTRRRLYLLAALAVVGMAAASALARADLGDRSPVEYQVGPYKVVEWQGTKNQWCTAIRLPNRWVDPVALDCTRPSSGPWR